ncbi:hypothetical protein AAFF_G00195940 [Aldrovandia affinis]|uniref:Protein moonraker n=1 Tax=Aldrovandia affinis TaxID=143900 RepID=A0AAD7W6W4_9TELE|nr:hypothetical protein AAFF_G00195940 [Aldrovandia affinis]
MTGKLQIQSQRTGIEELGHLTGSWVTSGLVQPRNGGYSQTQLLFNKALPANPSNRATHADSPAPILIEKLVPRVELKSGGSSVSSSLCFSALSEERLQAAVRLAKRDLRRRRQESIHGSPPQQNPDNTFPQNRSSMDHRKRAAGTKGEMTRSGGHVLLYEPQKLPLPPRTEYSLSPPTRDSALEPKAGNQEPKLSQEICRLQKELGTYIQRIEQLANRGQFVEEQLDPEEERRVEVRRQEQATRSARIIYVLQQQVKEIHEDLDKLRSQKIRHTKKVCLKYNSQSRAMDRLAAAHRGAVRAIQVFIGQLPDQSERKMPSHYRELGQLIRQLSLCSAKVEVGQGSAVPESAIDILQKLEALDSALSKQESPKKKTKELRVQSSSPVRRRSPVGRQHSTSPPRGPRGKAARGAQGLRKFAPVKPDRRLTGPWPRSADSPPLDRNERTKKGAPLHDGRFLQPTVSSRLREAPVPQKDATVPWIPASPHASPPQLNQPKRPQPKCLFSHLKQSVGPGEQLVRVGVSEEQELDSDKKGEALRQAWLDKETTRTLRELSQLSKEESGRINRLRSEVESPTLWAERAEREARDRLKPLLDQAQMIRESWDRRSTSLRHRLSEQAADRAAVNADLLSDAIMEELLDDTARALSATERSREVDQLAQQQLEAPTLESMLLRMEEMEKDQEAVRRRFADISYSDPLFWAKEDRAGAHSMAPGPRTASPLPIRLTKPALRAEPAADIVLESPVEDGNASETSLTDDISWPGPSGPAHPITVDRDGGVLLSLPISMQRNIQKYSHDYDSYLHLVSHEAVGSFNPWVIADGLAEELMSEAIADVAAEFQDVCEEYAEAVFTSEFLQPLQSPVASQM